MKFHCSNPKSQFLMPNGAVLIFDASGDIEVTDTAQIDELKRVCGMAGSTISDPAQALSHVSADIARPEAIAAAARAAAEHAAKHGNPNTNDPKLKALLEKAAEIAKGSSAAALGATTSEQVKDAAKSS